MTSPRGCPNSDRQIGSSGGGVLAVDKGDVDHRLGKSWCDAVAEPTRHLGGLGRSSGQRGGEVSAEPEYGAGLVGPKLGVGDFGAGPRSSPTR